MTPRKHILLAEDHEMVGQGLRALLATMYDVTGPVRDGSMVPAAVREHRPDVLVLDLSLPGRNGLDLIPEVRRASPATAILVVTMHTDYVLAKAAFSLGALGFMPKDCGVDELAEAIGKVMLGETYLSPRIHPQAGAGPTSPTARARHRLTPRQQAIMRSIAAGRSSEEIADELGVSVHTVHFHRRNIRRTLGIESDGGLIRFALLMELATDDGEPPAPSP